MGNKKNKLGKPSKASAGLNFKVRFKEGTGKGDSGSYVVTNRRRKQMGTETFKNHDKALEYAQQLHNETFK